jgi:CheY-like chemotaxis protein
MDINFRADRIAASRQAALEIEEIAFALGRSSCGFVKWGSLSFPGEEEMRPPAPCRRALTLPSGPQTEKAKQGNCLIVNSGPSLVSVGDADEDDIVSQPPSGTRVLIVEDDSIIAMTAEDMLDEVGCETAAIAGTVAEALARANDTEFDIALLDLNLKDENSLPVAHRLRESGKRFIFATGYDGLPADSGFADAPVISKPYRIEQLAKIIAETLSS